MDPLLIAGILTVVLFVLLAAGLWVSLTLMLLGLLTMVMLDNNAYGLIFATTTWGASSSWALTALPLFIWMGEILFRTPNMDTYLIYLQALVILIKMKTI